MAPRHEIYTQSDNFPEIQFPIVPPLSTPKLQEVVAATQLPRISYTTMRQPSVGSSLQELHSLITAEVQQGMSPDMVDQQVAAWRQQIAEAIKIGWPGVVVEFADEPVTNNKPTEGGAQPASTKRYYKMATVEVSPDYL